MGIKFPEYASVDAGNVWRFHKNWRSVRAVQTSRYCSDLVTVFKLVDNTLVVFNPSIEEKS